MSRTGGGSLLSQLAAKPATERFVDLCIVLDVTGSMGAWLNEAKEKLIMIREKVEPAAKNVNMTLRIAVVVYRDYDPKTRATWVSSTPFSKDPAAALTLLRETVADGGADEAEDVAGAIDLASRLEWQGYRRLLVHVCDAPPHGMAYHDADAGDSFADDASVPPELLPSTALTAALEMLAKKRVDYYLVRVGNAENLAHTLKMKGAFAEAYKRAKANAGQYMVGAFEGLELGNAAERFAEIVIMSVTQSMA